MIIRIIQSLKRLSLTGFSLGYTSYNIGAIRRNYTHKYVTWTVLDPAGGCLQLCSFILKSIGFVLCHFVLLLSESLIREGNGTHSSPPAWKIPWMEEPGGLQSMGSLGVRHNWATSRSLFTFMHWRRKWQPTPVFLPGESQGWGSLVGCRLWGRTELGTTEAT